MLLLMKRAKYSREQQGVRATGSHVDNEFCLWTQLLQ